MRYFYSLVLGLLFVVSAMAQQWTLYTTQNTGSNTLSSMYVRQIAQDKDGKIWFRAGESLFRFAAFDGTNWSVPSDYTGMSKFLFDNNGNLWVLYNDKLIEVTSTDTITYKPFNVYRNLTDFTVDNQGNIWLIAYYYTYYDGTVYPNAVAKFDGQNWTVYTGNDIPLRDLYHIAAKDGNAYIGTDSGLVVLDTTGNWTVFNTDNGLPYNGIQSLTFDSKGNLWIGTSRGLSKFDGISFSNYYNPDTAAYYVYADKDDNIWCTPGGNTGIRIFDGQNWTSLTTDDGLPSNYTKGFFQDKDGNMWIGTSAGAVKKQGDNFTVYTTHDGGLISNNIFSITIADDGTLYLGSFVGLTRYKDGQFSFVDNENSPKDDYIWSSIKGPDGKLYFQSCTDSIIYIYDGSTWEQKKLPAIYEECSYFDSKGNLWLGAWDFPGILKYDGKSFTQYTDTLLKNNVVSIAEDKNGNLYLSTAYGAKIVKFDGNKFYGFDVPDSNLVYVPELYTDKDGNLWICDYLALIKYDGTEFTTYNFNSIFNIDYGYSYGYVEDVTQDINGNYWFVGYFDSYDYNTGESYKYSALKFDGQNWTFFGKDDGLTDGGAFSVAVDKYNSIAIGFYKYGFAISEPEFYTVTFNVTDGSNPIKGATINVSTQTLVTGADGQATVELADGNYTAITSKDGFVNDTTVFTVNGSDVSVDITLEKEGTTDVDDVNNLVSVYPNPSHGTFTLNTTEDILQIKIYSTSGQEQHFTWNRTVNEINLRGKGIYIMKLTTTGGKQIIKKIIVK